MNNANVYRDESESLKRSVDEAMSENARLMKRLRKEREIGVLRALIHVGGSWIVYGIAAGINNWWCPKTTFWLVGANLCAWTITEAINRSKA